MCSGSRFRAWIRELVQGVDLGVGSEHEIVQELCQLMVMLVKLFNTRCDYFHALIVKF